MAADGGHRGPEKDGAVGLSRADLACAFCDYLFVLKDGRIAAQGTPKEICTPQMLEEVFRVRADVLALEDGRPYIVYRGSIR